MEYSNYICIINIYNAYSEVLYISMIARQINGTQNTKLNNKCATQYKYINK